MKRFYDKTWKKVLLAIVALVVIVGMFGGTDTEPTPEAKTAPVEKAERSEDCIKVDKALQKRILDDLEPVGTAWAVKADGFKNVYMVASKFELDGDTYDGVWGTNSLTLGEGLFISVDGMAQEFTPWPDSVNGDPLSIATPGAQEAKECL